MHTRMLWNAGVLILLLMLAMEAASMSRSLRRIEHEERRLVTHCVAERPTIWLGTPATRLRLFSTNSTMAIGQALLPVPNVMNKDADPAKFKPAPLNVVLHQYISLPGWTKANEFEELREWLIQQGFVIVRANGPEPSRTYPSIKFRGNVGEFNQAFHVTVMERSAGFPWCYSVFTDPLMPGRFAFRPSKDRKYIEGYSIGPDDSGVGPSCY